MKKSVFAFLLLGMLGASGARAEPARDVRQPLMALSRSPLAKYAFWRNRSLVTPESIADLKVVSGYLTAKKKATGEGTYLRVSGASAGIHVQPNGRLRTNLSRQPKNLEAWLEGETYTSIVAKIHTAAEDLRAGKAIVTKDYYHMAQADWLPPRPAVKGR